MNNEQVMFEWAEPTKVLTAHLTPEQYRAMDATPAEPEKCALLRIIGPKISDYATEMILKYGSIKLRCQVVWIGADAVRHAIPMTPEESAKYVYR